MILIVGLKVIVNFRAITEVNNHPDTKRLSVLLRHQPGMFGSNLRRVSSKKEFLFIQVYTQVLRFSTLRLFVCLSQEEFKHAKRT